MTNESRVHEYLTQLRTALTGMTVAEREDIVEEIRMHIRERADGEAVSVDEIIVALGAPQELAEQYRTGMLLQQARGSFSPLTVLRGTARWARIGVEGAVVFLAAIIGYLFAVAFLLLAILKPLFPEHTGLWVAPSFLDFSFHMGQSSHYPSASVHEVLGWWLIPVCLVVGSLTLLATTKVTSFLISRVQLRLPAVVQRGLMLFAH